MRNQPPIPHHLAGEGNSVRGKFPPSGRLKNLLPDTPKLATATDETLDFRTLKDRFDTYYDHVRKVARELEQRCEGHKPRPEAEPRRFGRRILDILYGVAQGKHGVRPRSNPDGALAGRAHL